MTSAVEFEGVSRHYGRIRAVDDVSITINEGEFFSMLGPSGSGKTTCLRLIAGFERPSAGAIRIHGMPSANLPPFLRDVNTVFQDYALFPHMNVRDNVAYGLMVKGVARAERHARAGEMLALVALEGFDARKPSQLSGGQRQRVALARALVNRPRVLLLDEPLGALDLKLREQMQGELKSLQRRLGITFVYVTHDQGEALSMSDRVAVFNQGRIEQLDTPKSLYMRPGTEFVANFVGMSNVLRGARARSLCEGGAMFSVRPEFVRLGGEAPASSTCIQVEGRVEEVQYHGASSRVVLVLDDGERLVANLSNATNGEPPTPTVGDRVVASWQRSAMVPLRERAG